MLIPFHVDVPMSRWPVANFAIIGVTIFVFFAVAAGAIPYETVNAMVHTGWDPVGLFGHMLLHADIVHLIGNMIFLWVFGNAVCAKIGNLPYIGLYVVFGLVAAIAQHMVQSVALHGAVGASGAINGVVGMYLVLYPLNNITCFGWVYIRAGIFVVSSFWIILLWLAFDIWGAMAGGGNVGYVAHLGGFAAGFAASWLIAHRGWVEERKSERFLTTILFGPVGDGGGRAAFDPVTARAVQGHLAAPLPSTDPFHSSRRRVAEPDPSPIPLESEPIPVDPVPERAEIRFACACGKRYKVPAAHAGKSARCKVCSAAMVVPGA